MLLMGTVIVKLWNCYKEKTVASAEKGRGMALGTEGGQREFLLLMLSSSKRPKTNIAKCSH